MWRRPHRDGLAVLLVLAAACTSGCEGDWEPTMPWERWSRTSEGQGQWENPDLPWEQWSRDRAECREVATERAEQEMAMTRTGSTVSAFGLTAGYQQSMARYDAGRTREELYERCLIDRGYRLVPREK